MGFPGDSGLGLPVLTSLLRRDLISGRREEGGKGSGCARLFFQIPNFHDKNPSYISPPVAAGDLTLSLVGEERERNAAEFFPPLPTTASLTHRQPPPKAFRMHLFLWCVVPITVV